MGAVGVLSCVHPFNHAFFPFAGNMGLDAVGVIGAIAVLTVEKTGDLGISASNGASSLVDAVFLSSTEVRRLVYLLGLCICQKSY